MTSLTANSPIRAGNRLNPPSKLFIPNVNRGNASIGAAPTIAIIKPNNPLNIPLVIDPSDKLEIRVKANIVIAKYSNGPNSIATFARRGETNINIIILISPALKDDTIANPSAFDAFQSWAIT